MLRNDEPFTPGEAAYEVALAIKNGAGEGIAHQIIELRSTSRSTKAAISAARPRWWAACRPIP